MIEQMIRLSDIIVYWLCDGLVRHHRIAGLLLTLPAVIRGLMQYAGFAFNSDRFGTSCHSFNKSLRDKRNYRRRRQESRRECGRQAARLKEDKDLFLPPSLTHHTPAPHLALCLIAEDACTRRNTGWHARMCAKWSEEQTRMHTSFVKSKSWSCTHEEAHTRAHTHTHALAVGRREFTMATGEWGSRIQSLTDTGVWTDNTFHVRAHTHTHVHTREWKASVWAVKASRCCFVCESFVHTVSFKRKLTNLRQ